jgi:hypothetical protein
MSELSGEAHLAARCRAEAQLPQRSERVPTIGL